MFSLTSTCAVCLEDFDTADLNDFMTCYLCDHICDANCDNPCELTKEAI